MLQVVVGGGDRRVDVEPQIARVQVGVEFLDEAQVGRAGIVGQALDVEREAAIDRIRREEANDLLAQRGALAGISSTSPMPGPSSACGD